MTDPLVEEARAIADARGPGHTTDVLRSLADRVEELEAALRNLLRRGDAESIQAAGQALSTHPTESETP